MLDRLIRFSLNNRPLVIALAVLLVILGVGALRQLPVDVLPDITRPTVTLLTESPGLAPEEVEARVTLPVESALQGVTGLYRLRSVPMWGFRWFLRNSIGGRISTGRGSWCRSGCKWRRSPITHRRANVYGSGVVPDGEILLIGCAAWTERSRRWMCGR